MLPYNTTQNHKNSVFVLGVSASNIGNKNITGSFLLSHTNHEHLQIRDALGKKVNASPLRPVAFIGSWIMK